MRELSDLRNLFELFGLHASINSNNRLHLVLECDVRVKLEPQAVCQRLHLIHDLLVMVAKRVTFLLLLLVVPIVLFQNAQARAQEAGK